MSPFVSETKEIEDQAGLRAAQPLVKTDATESRLAQRHERALLDSSTPVWGLGIADDITRVAHCLQVAGDDFV